MFTSHLVQLSLTLDQKTCSGDLGGKAEQDGGQASSGRRP
jgi:hypothetical protein